MSLKRAAIDRFIDCYGEYATSHEAFDHEHALHEEVRNAARAGRAGHEPASRPSQA